ncbi:MAG: YkgJ family cysteine cluster protein [Halodesulfurarchaeum sp.]
MERLEAALDWARSIDPESIAEDLRAIGFACTRCGRCCSGTAAEPHTATVFPGEIREIREETGRDWSEIARPMPYGIRNGTGETFEWALQSDDGDCVFLDDDGEETRCAIYGSRPLLCRTYPFRLALPGTGTAGDTAVAAEGRVRASECPGLGRPLSHERAIAIAETLRIRAVRELRETIALREHYVPHPDRNGIVVHDSEGAKRPDGTAIER